MGTRLHLFALGLLTLACSGGTSAGTSDSGAPISSTTTYDALFGPPSNPTSTPDSLTGVWAGGTGSADVRLKFSATSIVIALRCRSQTAIGIEVSASVSATSFKYLESKEAEVGEQEPSCRVAVRPVEFPACASADAGSGCFRVKGTVLSFENAIPYLGPFSQSDSSFTKLSD